MTIFCNGVDDHRALDALLSESNCGEPCKSVGNADARADIFGDLLGSPASGAAVIERSKNFLVIGFNLGLTSAFNSFRPLWCRRLGFRIVGLGVAVCRKTPIRGRVGRAIIRVGIFLTRIRAQNVLGNWHR